MSGPQADRTTVSVTVNGTVHRRDVEPRIHLADFLREEIGLTGTHLGCEQGVCGMVHGAARRPAGEELPRPDAAG
jgi:xanthine dehydrogenase iron-sulfur cluster and FAD-binding subunit A